MRRVGRLARVALMAGTLLATNLGATPERVDELVRTALNLEASPKRGAAIYERECLACHGKLAFGDAEQLIPALAGQRQNYLIRQMAEFTERDRLATEMHRVLARAAVREPQAWRDVAAYLNAQPAAVTAQTGNGEMVSLGEALYQQWCSSCHDTDGRGDDEGFVPSLRHQHYSYLVSEMRGLAVGHRFNAEADLQRFLNELTTDEIQGIADYLSRLRGPVRDRTRLHDDGSAGD